MSNTIRRKNQPLPNYVRTKYGIHPELLIWTTTPREGKELEDKILEFHADWGVGYHKHGVRTFTRKRREERFKMRSKQELAKFWKDPEYEVQVHNRFRCDRD